MAGWGGEPRRNSGGTRVTDSGVLEFIRGWLRVVSGDAATSASRNVGRFVALEDLSPRFTAASHDAKVGYLMPHWAANCGALRLLAS